VGILRNFVKFGLLRGIFCPAVRNKGCSPGKVAVIHVIWWKRTPGVHGRILKMLSVWFYPKAPAGGVAVESVSKLRVSNLLRLF
jgi:hypothetical protein